MDVSVDNEQMEKVVVDVPVDEQECFVTLSHSSGLFPNGHHRVSFYLCGVRTSYLLYRNQILPLSTSLHADEHHEV